jgi:hypothetical protein
VSSGRFSTRAAIQLLPTGAEMVTLDAATGLGPADRRSAAQVQSVFMT